MEYKLITGKAKEVEDNLNAWETKHDLEILGMDVSGQTVVVLVGRKEKKSDANS